MVATNKSKIGYKVKSLLKYAQTLNAEFSMFESSFKHWADLVAGKTYATTVLTDDASAETLYSVLNDAATEMTAVRGNIKTYVDSTTSTEEDTYRRALNTTDGHFDSTHKAIIDKVFDALVGTFPGSQVFNNSGTVADNTTSDGIITNWSIEDMEEHLLNLKQFVDFLKIALPIAYDKLRDVDRTTGTLVTTLHTTTFEAIITAQVDFYTDASKIVDDYERLINNVKAGQVITASNSSTLRSSIAGLKNQYDNLLTAAITDVTTEIDA